MKIIFCILLLNLAIGLKSQTNQYAFSINKDSVRWKEISQIERVQLLQIPDDLLKRISTRELALKCLEYPYIIDILFHSDYQQGFEGIVSSFNGLYELVSRQDAGKCALRIYKELNIELISKDTSLYNRGRFSFKLLFLEMLLADYRIQNQLYMKERKMLVEEVITKYNQKKNYPDMFSNKTMQGLCFTLEKSLEKDKYPRYIEMKQKKVMEGIPAPSVLHLDYKIEEIIELSNLYLNQ